MTFSFYLSGFIAVLATLCVIIHTNPVHTLLYLIISLLAISGTFFSLGAYFAGALEIIIYAGAIMVLFIFVVMMLNLNKSIENQKERHLQSSLCMIGPFLLFLLLLALIIYSIMTADNHEIDVSVIDAKEVGISLFYSYLLVMELASMLLLAGLIVAFHIGRRDRYEKILNKFYFSDSTSTKS